MEMKQNEMKSICAPTPAAQKNTVKKAGKTSSAVWDLGTGSRDAWTFTRTLYPEPWPKCRIRIRGERWKGLLFANRFRINLCAPFSEIWAPLRRVHDICLDSQREWGLYME